IGHVGSPETPEKPIERGTLLERRILITAHLRSLVELDADRDHRGLHLFDDVGKAGGPLRALGKRRGGECRQGREIFASVEEHGDAETGGRGKQHEARRGPGRPRRNRWFGVAHGLFSIEARRDAPRRTVRSGPRREASIQRWGNPPYGVLSARLKSGKVRTA